MKFSNIQSLLYHIVNGHFFKQLQFSGTETKWTSIFLFIFAVVFLVVGLYRNVEIRESKIRPRLKLLFYFLHSIGVINLSFTILLLAIDIHRVYQDTILPFFMASVVLLFPLHIYLALTKRIFNSELS